MQRHSLLKHLHDQGCRLLREGKKHSIYWNTGSGNVSAVPRHTEIDNKLALKICRDLNIPPP
ncbi:MAG: addiction module toxin, HicA family [Chloroflexota bacterium]|nr:addiction module toxin, HicA family [Chloroflexota bacterium]